jgi:serine/threonine protein kinase
VKLCTHKVTKEERAVKFMRKEHMTPKAKLWFDNEIAILKTLDHPHIVRLFEIYEDE